MDFDESLFFCDRCEVSYLFDWGWYRRNVKPETSSLPYPTDIKTNRNTDCDYSSAYITLLTSSPSLRGHGMTFTIGRGNDIVCTTISQIASKLIDKNIESLFANMGETWDWLNSDPQMRWIGPEKGVVHIALGAVGNAIWDLRARWSGKPLWKLIVDFTPVSCL